MSPPAKATSSEVNCGRLNREDEQRHVSRNCIILVFVALRKVHGMNSLLVKNRASLEALCRKHGVAKLEMFGSATQETYVPGSSDLDFLVCFHPCTPEEHAERYLGMLADLQDLFHCDIDLVESNAVKNPFFLDCIAAARITVYAA